MCSASIPPASTSRHRTACSVAPSVRLVVGFFVGAGRAINEKHETTLAANQLALLEKPLSRDWLEKRVRISHSAAPVRDGHHQIAPISEADYESLQAHPQFYRP